MPAGARISHVALDPGEICLWTLGVEESALEATADLLQSLLSPGEQDEARRIAHPGSRRRFIVGRSLLRQVLSAHASVSAEAWQFERDANRKPHVRAPALSPPIRFSVSHTEGMIACVASLADTVAVDVERIAWDPDLEAVAAEVLTPSERTTLEQLPTESWAARFFEYWTLKEAYAKARGVGLQLNLRDFEFVLDGSGSIRLRSASGVDDDCSSWKFWRLHNPPHHVVSVAARRDFEGAFELVSRPVTLGPGGLILAA